MTSGSKPIRVLFVNRAKGQFWSIEELFRSVVASLPIDIESRVATVPQSGAKWRTIWKNLSWISRHAKADCVHITGDIHYGVLAVWDSPVVLTIHDLRFIDESTGIKRLLLWLFWIYLPIKFASHVTVISEFTKERLLRWTRIPASRISVIPNCVDPAFHRCDKIDSGAKPIVLQIGTTSNKNLDRVVTACAGLSLTLWILGRLSETQHQNLKANGIEYREFYDLDRADVIRLYHDCDLVCFPSTYEGFGLPIIEAQAVGRPVLTSMISPLCEVAGEGALLVDPMNIDSIRSGLIQLMQDAVLRKNLVAKGFANVQKYSPQTVAAQYAEVYRSLVELS